MDGRHILGCRQYLSIARGPLFWNRSHEVKTIKNIPIRVIVQTTSPNASPSGFWIFIHICQFPPFYFSFIFISTKSWEAPTLPIVAMNLFHRVKIMEKVSAIGAWLDVTVVNIRCVAIVIWHVCLTVAWSSWGTPGDRGGVIRTHLSKVTCGSGEGVHRNCRGRDLVLDTGHMCIKDFLSLAGDTCEEKPGMQFSQVICGSRIISGRGEGGVFLIN